MYLQLTCIEQCKIPVLIAIAQLIINYFSDEATPSKKKKNNVLDFLKEKQEKEFSIKESELEL